MIHPHLVDRFVEQDPDPVGESTTDSGDRQVLKAGTKWVILGDDTLGHSHYEETDSRLTWEY